MRDCRTLPQKLSKIPLHPGKKPYYNPRTLVQALGRVKGIRLPQARHNAQKTNRSHGYLRIGDVARLVGVSPSSLRTWESVGLISPTRTESQYRLFTPRDVRLLKRAQFLRRARGMNAPAIMHLLRSEGLLKNGNNRKPSPVGQRLRKLRLKKRASLSQVAKSTGVSVGFLSALERGQMSASISTLSRIARFYHINILSLFDASESNPRHVRPNERKILEAGPGVRMELLAWGDAVMEPHLFRVAPGAGSGDSYAHEGEEFLYILKGSLEIALEGGEPAHLREGDSFYFASNMKHNWSNPGKQEACVLWVNTPPTF
jgi:DNA-binding transcriptional MerR regulator/quercetin dioxygenase-like cupin family protein